MAVTTTMKAPSKNADAAFREMQGNLSKYAKANDRRMVLRSIHDVKYLACVPLDPFVLGSEDISLDDMEAEVAQEHVVLNGIPFRRSPDFLMTLRELCKQLSEGVPNLTVDQLYLFLVVRMSRTASSADAYFKLNSLLGSPELMLMPTKNHQEPIQVNLYVSHNCVHATVSATYSFGLFRKADIKPAELVKGSMSGKPWISVQATVNERVNLSTSDAVRTLSVRTPDAL
jgi:hypothetical protein